jgi:hypothetical protein
MEKRRLPKSAAPPRWEDVAFHDRKVSGPQDGLIVIAYWIDARRGQDRDTAYCKTTYRRPAHDDWRVVQHPQSPVHHRF